MSSKGEAREHFPGLGPNRFDHEPWLTGLPLLGQKLQDFVAPFLFTEGLILPTHRYWWSGGIPKSDLSFSVHCLIALALRPTPNLSSRAARHDRVVWSPVKGKSNCNSGKGEILYSEFAVRRGLWLLFLGLPVASVLLLAYLVSFPPPPGLNGGFGYLWL